MNRFYIFLFLIISILFEGEKKFPSFIVEVYFDSHLENDIVFETLLAMDEWETATKGEVKFINKEVISYDDYKKIKSNSIFLKSDISSSKELSKMVEMKYNTLAFYHYKTKQIIVVKNHINDNENLNGIMLHEIGHALGLGHTNIKNTIMYPTTDGASLHLTETDIRQFCYKNYCYWQ